MGLSVAAKRSPSGIPVSNSIFHAVLLDETDSRHHLRSRCKAPPSSLQKNSSLTVPLGLLAPGRWRLLDRNFIREVFCRAISLPNLFSIRFLAPLSTQ